MDNVHDSHCDPMTPEDFENFLRKVSTIVSTRVILKNQLPEYGVEDNSILGRWFPWTKRVLAGWFAWTKRRAERKARRDFEMYGNSWILKCWWGYKHIPAEDMYSKEIR